MHLNSTPSQPSSQQKNYRSTSNSALHETIHLCNPCKKLLKTENLEFRRRTRETRCHICNAYTRKARQITGDSWSNEVHAEITNLRTEIRTCRTRIIDALTAGPKTLPQLDKATQSPSFITDKVINDLLHRGLIASNLFNMTYYKTETNA